MAMKNATLVLIPLKVRVCFAPDKGQQSISLRAPVVGRPGLLVKTPVRLVALHGSLRRNHCVRTAHISLTVWEREERIAVRRRPFTASNSAFYAGKYLSSSVPFCSCPSCRSLRG
jgi:hypothetical protein